MSTRQSIKAVPMKMVNDSIDRTENMVKKANGYAMNATEVLVSETLNVVEQWQPVANKAIKGGLKLAATQQDIIFDALNGVKDQFSLSRKRFTKLIS